MKTLRMGRVCLLGGMLASKCVSSAALETLSVTENSVAFTVVLYEGTYRLKFRQEGTRSFYTFNTATQVTGIEVGKETYNVRGSRILLEEHTLSDTTF